MMFFFWQIIDLEFAHVGVAAADIATYLAHLIFAYYAHKLDPAAESGEYHVLLEEAIRESCEFS